MNYFYDSENHTLEVYFGDTLLVELPYCDPMTNEEAEKLACELFEDYLEAQQ
jgi:hypothetical protein